MMVFCDAHYDQLMCIYILFDFTFLEPESVVFQEISAEVSFDAFFSFHSGINHIYIPYSGKLLCKTSQLG